MMRDESGDPEWEACYVQKAVRYPCRVCNLLILEVIEGRQLMPVYRHVRSTEPQLSGRRLKHTWSGMGSGWW
jgi:hypothetical protein